MFALFLSLSLSLSPRLSLPHAAPPCLRSFASLLLNVSHAWGAAGPPRLALYGRFFLWSTDKFHSDLASNLSIALAWTMPTLHFDCERPTHKHEHNPCGYLRHVLHPKRFERYRTWWYCIYSWPEPYDQLHSCSLSAAYRGTSRTRT